MGSDRILELARECLETPFAHQGRVPGVGLDCAGLLVHVFQGLGVRHEDTKGYPRIPVDGRIKRILDAQPCLSVIGRPEPGCAMLFRIADRDPQHIAICTGEGMIHAFSTAKKVVEHTFSNNWRQKLICCYRIDDVR